MPSLSELINKYKDKPSDTRLVIILESYQKESKKAQINALKMLIEDDDLDAIAMFLGDKEAMKAKEEAQIAKLIEEESKRPPNQDDFEIFVSKQLGKPEDPEALGNKILSGQTVHWYMKTHIRPEVLLNKFARLANRESVEIDSHPSFKTNPATYECCLAGVKVLNKQPMTVIGN